MRSFLGLVFLAVAFAYPAAAAERRCAGSNATIYAESDADARLACDGVADAVGFLSEQGFTVDTVMWIDILDSVFAHRAENPAFRVLGQFDAEQNRIMVTSTKGQHEMAAEKPIFGVPAPYDHALFRSVVAHEVAHAIAEENFRVDEPSRLAHEYIAYIVQLATMPANLQQQILERHPGPGFVSELEIHPIIYGMDPDLFAVKAYRHYRRPEVGVAFLQSMLHRDLISIFPQWEDQAARDPLADSQTANSSNDRR
jgi:hypothetical protein